MKVAIIMGSISDRSIGEQVEKMLARFEIEYETKIISAHRTPEIAAQFAKNAEENGFGVIIAIAGKAAHLAGVIAGITTLPVIGIPAKSSTMDGLDSLLSVVQMPSGVPVATVAIDGGKNAAILATQILSLSDERLKDRLRQYKEELASEVEDMNKELQNNNK